MDLIKNRKVKKNISVIFLLFLFKIVAGLLLSVIIPILFYFVLGKFDVLRYANYDQNEVETIINVLPTFKEPLVTMENMDGSVRYLYFDNDEQIIGSNMDEEQIEGAFRYYKTGFSGINDNYLHTIINFENGNTAVIIFLMESYFTIDFLNDNLPNPENLVIIMMIVLGFFSIIFQIHFLSKYFNREIKTVYKAMEIVQKQDLESDMGHSDVADFEDVLRSFEKMQLELKKSMTKQWDLEEEKRRQVASLAHDLKTPLTISLGNTELLMETGLDSDQEEIAKAIYDGLVRLEDYTKLLSQMTTNANSYSYDMREQDMIDFLSLIEEQGKYLCKTKEIDLVLDSELSELDYCFDDRMMERVLMNIIHNAVEYTSENGYVKIKMYIEKENLVIIVEDSGKGFTNDMLRHGTELFAMDNTSRDSKNHYGIGLYFANQVVEQHAGKLILNNSKETGGGIVKIVLPYKKQAA